MLLAITNSGLWRVLWYSLIGLSAIALYAGALRTAGIGWARIRWSLIGAYIVAYVWWFFANGIIIDRVSVLWSFAIFLTVASVGRPPREWMRSAGDLGVFVAMWLAYDESRGIADGLGMPIQVESVRNLDRLLFFGADPVVELQAAFHRTEIAERVENGEIVLRTVTDVQWYDVVGSFVYYSHFIVPPIVIGALWLINRHQWVRYMRRFATLLFGACVMFVLLPTAPPWMAAGGTNRVGLDLAALPPLSRHTGVGWRYVGLGSFVEAWDTGRDWANQVAAMPSLHSAFALFVVMFFWPWVHNPWARAAMLAYPLAMAVALAYFAEHYIVDAVAGWLLVGTVFWLWNRIEAWLAERSGPIDDEPLDYEKAVEARNSPISAEAARA
ncbi:MAG: phosphatase PAP2 family protein [Ilumatobacter sp.]|nr:phosphatase PAP2 family protein [Ilumatobacter sp.]